MCAHASKSKLTNVLYGKYLIGRTFLFGGILLLAGCGADPISPAPTFKEQQKEEVLFDKIELQKSSTHTIELTTSGTLALSNDFMLSFPMGGKIRDGILSEGSSVRKGAVLAEIYDETISLREEQAELGLKKAKVVEENALLALENAKEAYKSVVNLYEDKAASQEDVDKAKFTLENMRAKVIEAEVGVELGRSKVNAIEVNNTNLQIKAPQDGQILQVLAHAGELVRPFQPVVQFGRQGKRYAIEAGIIDRDFLHVRLGDSARIVFDAFPQKQFSGIVEEKGVLPDPKTGTYKVKIKLLPDADLSDLSLGMFARVKVVTTLNMALVKIPVNALLSGNGLTGEVFIAENNRPVKRSIDIYKIIDDNLLISNGLDNGELLMVRK